VRVRPAPHLVVGVLGIAFALVMIAGALGPWAETPVVNISGWAGIGLPLVIVAFILLAFQAAFIASHRRAWLAVSALLAGLALVVALVIALVVSTLSRFGNLLALLLTRGNKRYAFGAGHPVTVGWGLYVLGGGALGLIVASSAGMFVRAPAPGEARADVASAVGQPAEFDPDWLDPS
jgi:hypothetical protein